MFAGAWYEFVELFWVILYVFWKPLIMSNVSWLPDLGASLIEPAIFQIRQVKNWFDQF